MGGFIAPTTLEQIRAANDIVDVIGAAIPLKRAGANFLALCPFHREKTPSFTVNPRRQSFHCFGCHKGGDVFTFIKEYEGLDFPEAVKRLAERARIPLEFEHDPNYQQNRHIKDVLLDIHEQITNRWHQCLRNDAAAARARDYLQQRGVSMEAMKLFRLGFSPEPWDDTVNWAKSKGFDLAMAEQGGLVLRKEGSDHYYGRFRGRLMFPIADEQGRVIGFSGRILPGDDDTRKYVNSPETPLFTKSRVIFGLDKSKRALLDKQSAIICEGQLDLISCYMAGVRNVVAPQGTALTSEHTRILKRYVNEVVLCFDSDNAGQNATVRALDDLLASGLAVRVATVPAPHDPDSFIKEFGAAAFEEIIAKAGGFFDYFLGRLCATNNINSDAGQQKVLRAMAEAAAKTKDEAIFDRAARKTASRLGLDPLTAVARFKRALTASHSPSRENEPEETDSPLPRPDPKEYYLLKLVLAHDGFLEWTRAHLDLEWVKHPVVKYAVGRRLEEGEPPSPARILGETEDPKQRAILSEAVVQEHLVEKAPAMLRDVVLHLRNNAIEKQIAGIRGQLADPNLPSEETIRLLKEQNALRDLKKQPIPEPPQV